MLLGFNFGFGFFFPQILMSAVPSLVRCAETDGVSMKLVPSNAYVMKDMNLLWMGRIALVCMIPHGDVKVLIR